MADKSVSIDLIIKSSEAASSLKEVKQSLKDIKDAMIGAGEGSPEFLKLARAAGELKDKVDDANEAIKAVNPNKFQAVATFAASAASGVAAVTGAMGLFGAESEEVTKTLAKVQSAMALSQGLAGLSELPKAWNALKAAMAESAVVQKIVTAGQWLWNAAIMANPIGAIVAGVAALTAGIYFLVKALGEEDKNNQIVTESLNKLKESRDKQNESLDQQLRIQKALGLSGIEATEAEIKNAKIKLKGIQELSDKFREYKDATKEQNLEQTKRYEEENKLRNDLDVLYATSIKLRGDADDKKLSDDKAKSDKANADYKARREEKAKSDKAEKDDKAKIDEEYRLSNLTAEQKSFDDFYNAQKVFLDNKNITQEEFNQKLIDRQAGIDALRLEAGKKANADAAAQAIIDSQTEVSSVIRGIGADKIRHVVYANGDEADISLAEEGMAEQKAIRKKEFTDKLELALKLNEGLQSLSDMAFTIKMHNTKKGSAEEEKALRAQFKINKALQLSSVIIQGILAAQTAYAAGVAAGLATTAGVSSLPLGAIYAGVSIAGTLAAIAKISATQFDTTSVGGLGGGGGGGGTDLNTGAATATSNSQPSTLLNPDGTVANQNTPTPAPIQVYVVESDITSKQTQVAVVQNQMNFQ
jgi:hypothetical protein